MPSALLLGSREAPATPDKAFSQSHRIFTRQNEKNSGRNWLKSAFIVLSFAINVIIGNSSLQRWTDNAINSFLAPAFQPVTPTLSANIHHVLQDRSRGPHSNPSLDDFLGWFLHDAFIFFHNVTQKPEGTEALQELMKSTCTFVPGTNPRKKEKGEWK